MLACLDCLFFCVFEVEQLFSFLFFLVFLFLFFTRLNFHMLLENILVVKSKRGSDLSTFLGQAYMYIFVLLSGLMG